VVAEFRHEAEWIRQGEAVTMRGSMAGIRRRSAGRIVATGLLLGALGAAAPAGRAAQPPVAGPRTTLLPSTTRLLAGAIEPNGDVVAAGERLQASGTPQLLVARFTPAGAPDRSFGHDGLAIGPAVPGAAGSQAAALAIQPDGGIVVAGSTTDAHGGGNLGILVERFRANGTLDRRFGRDGIVQLLTGKVTQAEADAVAIAPDATIVVGGRSNSAAIPFATVARLTAGGALDRSFGIDGVDVLGSLGSFSAVKGLAVQPNDRIVLAGSNSPGLQNTFGLVARLTAGGSLDGSFSGGSVVRQYAPPGGAYSAFNSVAVQPDGRIVAAGQTTAGGEKADAFVARFTATGRSDRTFGRDGVAYAQAAQQWLASAGTNGPGAVSLALAANGDTIVAGTYNIQIETFGTVWAFTAAGRPDPRFGHAGSARLVVAGGRYSELAGVAIAPDSGRVVAVGDALHYPQDDYAGLLASYSGPPEPALKLSLRRLSTDRAGTRVTLQVACSLACAVRAGATEARRTLASGQAVRSTPGSVTVVLRLGQVIRAKRPAYLYVTVSARPLLPGRAATITRRLRLP
jgi:uncharacterized delta-60 repeat protein